MDIVANLQSVRGSGDAEISTMQWCEIATIKGQ